MNLGGEGVGQIGKNFRLAAVVAHPPASGTPPPESWRPRDSENFRLHVPLWTFGNDKVWDAAAAPLFVQAPRSVRVRKLGHREAQAAGFVAGAARFQVVRVARRAAPTLTIHAEDAARSKRR